MTNVTTEEREKKKRKNAENKEYQKSQDFAFCLSRNIRALPENGRESTRATIQGRPKSSIQFLDLQPTLLMRFSLSCIVQLSETHCSDF